VDDPVRTRRRRVATVLSVRLTHHRHRTDQRSP